MFIVPPHTILISAVSSGWLLCLFGVASEVK